LLAIAMILDETSRLDAARLTEWTVDPCETGFTDIMRPSTVWCRANHPGRRRKLTVAQMAELRELVIAGPDPKTHKVIRWRCVDLRAEVARRFAVSARAHDRQTAAQTG
jgi:hypothetical protein